MRIHRFISVFLIFCFVFGGCKKEPEATRQTSPQNSTHLAAVYTYEIVNVYPHDSSAFTQGLEIYKGDLYESTGLNGHSSLRRVELKTGKVLQKIDIDKDYFAEGMTIFNGKIYQLTYQTHIGFIYDMKTFQKIGSWQYEGEGWGLTHDDKNLIMSNGSNKILYLDPNNLSITKTLDVTDEGMLVENLNELEFINGEIYANIWQTDRIAIIDTSSGKVSGWIDLGGILPPMERTERIDVLNGIASDKDRVLNGVASDDKTIFVTGKLWPKLFEIKIKKKELALQ